MALTGKQELALQLAKTAVQDWRQEQARAADGLAHSRTNAVRCLKEAVGAGVPQTLIAEECGWARQRVHQLVSE